MASLSKFGRTALVSAALLLTVATGACSRPATQSTADSAGSGPLRIAVGIDASYAPFFVADQEGMFDAAGGRRTRPVRSWWRGRRRTLDRAGPDRR